MYLDPLRVTQLNSRPAGPGPVLYWMSRDQRVRDNWALLFAAELAAERNAPLEVAFCLSRRFLGASAIHYSFMLGGLARVERDLESRGIGFQVLEGEPAGEVASLARRLRAGAVVCDFDPLRIKRRWRAAAARGLDVVLFEVDAHNIVPCRYVSQKQEYAAFTLRPKLHSALPGFLREFPVLAGPRVAAGDVGRTEWEALTERYSGGAAPATAPGESAGLDALRDFVDGRLKGYAENSSDPNSEAESGLSPYLHFGQLSAQRAALEVMGADAPAAAKEAFLEQLIVRRELSDNFCLYNSRYDSFAGFPDWARRTLDAHRDDPREYIYGFRQLEAGRTHDELWNAAQLQMVATGKMHNYLRIYWAKKILEWTRSPEDAVKYAIKLNDRYELDGRDPNGYVGVAWSIGGVHDRGWRERKIFGTIRYMSLEGCRRKFDVDAYVRRVDEQASRAAVDASS